MLEGAGHAGDLSRPGADGLRGLAPCRGHGRDLFDDRSGLRQRECEIFRRLFEQIERAGSLVEVDVRRQHTRLEIGGHRIEVIGGRERPPGLAEPEKAVVAQMIVDIGDQHIEGDAPIERVGVRLSLRARLGQGIDDLGVAATLAVPGAHHRHCGQERDADRAIAIEASR